MAVPLYGGNVAGLLPSPQVAIQNPPRDESLTFALSEGLRAIRTAAEEKRDVDNFKAEAEAYAKYFEDKGVPTISNIIRAQADNVRPMTSSRLDGIDTNKARSQLLQGILGFVGKERELERSMEIANIKARAESDNINENTRLRAYNEISNNLNRAIRSAQAYDTNYRIARDKILERKRDLARRGIVDNTPLPRYENPHYREANIYRNQLSEITNTLKTLPSGAGADSSVPLPQSEPPPPAVSPDGPGLGSPIELGDGVAPVPPSEDIPLIGEPPPPAVLNVGDEFPTGDIPTPVSLFPDSDVEAQREIEAIAKQAVATKNSTLNSYLYRANSAISRLGNVYSNDPSVREQVNKAFSDLEKNLASIAATIDTDQGRMAANNYVSAFENEVNALNYAKREEEKNRSKEVTPLDLIIQLGEKLGQ
jgi:hypothetical protein